jgi:predicted transcriptional regulator
MSDWSFLTNHARVLSCIAHDPGVRLRDIAATLNITERSAFAIVSDLITGGFVAKEKDGRRNRYHIQVDAPLGEVIGRMQTIGELLRLMVGAPTPSGTRPSRR